MSAMGQCNRMAGLEIKDPALSLQRTQRQGRGTRFEMKSL
jgi:hypothetical protein